MIDLYFAWYSVCRKHMTITTTPVVVQDVTDQVWPIEKSLSEVATA